MTAPKAETSKKCLRILLVEDDPSIQETAAELLKLIGHDVTVTGCGEDALSVLERESFNVLFTDVKLPGISGVELAAQARTLHPALYILFTSGHDQDRIFPGNTLPDKAHLLSKPYYFSDIEAFLSGIS